MSDRELVTMMAIVFAGMAIHQAHRAAIHRGVMRDFGAKPSRFNWVPCAYWAGLAVYAGWRAWA